MASRDCARTTKKQVRARFADFTQDQERIHDLERVLASMAQMFHGCLPGASLLRQI